MDNIEKFNIETFNSLFIKSPLQAQEYRDKFRNPEVVKKQKETGEWYEDVKTHNEKYWDEVDTKPMEDTPQPIDKNELSVDEIKGLLKNAWIKYSNLAKPETLVKKCIENNLL